MTETLDDRRPLVRTLHLGVLWAFAVAQPLFDVLARDAAFFVVRRSEPLDLVLTALVMVVVLPLGLAIVPFLLHLLWKPLGTVAHNLLVAALGAIIALPPLKRAFLQTSDEALLVLAALSGLMALAIYVRVHWARTFLTVMAPAPLLFAAAFLLTPSIRKVVSPPETEIVSGAEGATADVVMLVLDELPLAALLDREGDLDEELFPGFARLSARTTWLRNASASHESTTWVVPSLLSGRLPGGDDELPIAHDHPRSLFTLLGDSHRMAVIESITDICPASLSGEAGEVQPLLARLESLSKDLSLVLAHVIAPQSLVAHLPSVTGNWGSFWRDVTSQRERVDAVDRFLFELADDTTDARPGLHFLHVLLPHIPYAYLPSGKQYTHPDAVVDPHEFESWPTQPWWSQQAMQRFMLQLAMVDGLINDLLDRMDETGLSETAVLVVTADHGVSFQPGGDRRRASEDNLDDLLYVPLFVGRPGQRQGLTLDRNVESIDVLPTIADLLGVPLPWRVDGVSAFGKTDSSRPQKTLARRSGEALVVDAALPAVRPLREQLGAVFGEPLSWAGIEALGLRPALVGRDVSSLKAAGSSPHHVVLAGTGSRPMIDLDGDSLPAYLAGQLIVSPERAPAPSELTVAVNGTVIATVPLLPDASDDEGAGPLFTVIIPEGAFVDGRNIITLLEQDAAGLWWTVGGDDWRLRVSPAGVETLSAGDDRALNVDRTAVRGALDRAEAAHGVLRLSGWAINLDNGEPADNVLVFVDGECVFAGHTGHERSDAGEISGDGAAAQSGFELELPMSSVGDLSRAPLRVFATSGDAAAELTYAHDAGWVSVVQHHLDDGVLVGSDGSRRTPRVGPLDGVLDTALIEDDRLNLLGWAADLEGSRNAELLLVLVDGRQVYSGRIWLERASLADDLGDPALHHAGFHHKLPLDWFGGPPDGRVQVFAVNGDHAVELRPTENARWVTPQSIPDQLQLDPRDASAVTWVMGDSVSELGTVTFNASDGWAAELTPWSLGGALDAAVDDGETLRLLGWAVDTMGGRPADHIVVLLDGQHLVAATPWLERSDVAETLGDEGLLPCGFQLVLPRAALSGDLPGRLSVVAVAGALAMELPFGAGAQWLQPTDDPPAPEPGATTPATEPLVPALTPDAPLDPETMTLVDTGLASGTGQLWRLADPLSSPLIDGAIDSALVEGGQLTLHGWAIDLEALTAAPHVVVVRDGTVLAVTDPSVERPDLVSTFDAPGLRSAGFTVALDLDGDQAGRVAVYALVGSSALRLRSSAAAAWIDQQR